MDGALVPFPGKRRRRKKRRADGGNNRALVNNVYRSRHPRRQSSSSLVGRSRRKKKGGRPYDSYSDQGALIKSSSSRSLREANNVILRRLSRKQKLMFQPGPGPGQYNAHTSGRMNVGYGPKVSFGKSAKLVDRSINDFPGPGTYSVELARSSSHGQSIGSDISKGASILGARVEEYWSRNNTPGAAAYYPSVLSTVPSAPSFSFGQKIPKDYSSTSGPAGALFTSCIGKMQQSRHKTAPAFSFASKSEESIDILFSGPGANAYKLVNLSETTHEKPPAFSMGQRTWKDKKDQGVPGPQYYPKVDICSNKKRSPSCKFGTSKRTSFHPRDLGMVRCI